jgi:hypothetical protein
VRAALDFLKTNVFYIACGVAVLAAIGTGAWGIAKMSDVNEQMRSVQSVYGQFASVSRSPSNDKTIAAEKNRVDRVQRYYANLIAKAKTFNTYEPLQSPSDEPFFPTPSLDGKLQFRNTYVEQFNILLDRLNAGLPPSQADIAITKEIMEQELLAAQNFGADEDTDDQSDPTKGDALADKESYKSGLITVAAARQSPATRAAIRRAKEIYCYASLDSFQIDSRFVQAGAFSAPAPEDMWRAQLTLWIQQDISDALARANEEAAEALRAKGQSPWVGNLPVKELISIRVSDYLPTEKTRGEHDVLGDEPAYPPATSEVVFTKTTSTDLYDVVQFSIKMIVDPTALPTVLDEISRNRFHTLLNVQYAFDNSLVSLDMTGKIYGSGPVVQVLLDYETIFFGDTYRRIMPDVVLEKLGKTRPGQEDK